MSKLEMPACYSADPEAKGLHREWTEYHEAKLEEQRTSYRALLESTREELRAALQRVASCKCEVHRAQLSQALDDMEVMRREFRDAIEKLTPKETTVAGDAVSRKGDSRQ